MDGCFATPGAIRAGVEDGLDPPLAITVGPLSGLALAVCGLPSVALFESWNRPAWLPAAITGRALVLATAEPEAHDVLEWIDTGTVRKRIHFAPYADAAAALASDPEAFAARVTGMLTLIHSCYSDPPGHEAAEPEPIGDGPAAAMEYARYVFAEYVEPPEPPGYVGGAWLWYGRALGCYREAWPEPWPGFGRCSECRVWITARTETAALALFEQHVRAGHMPPPCVA